MPKQANSAGGGSSIERFDKPWPEGRYVMMIRGAYPGIMITQKGKRMKITRLVYDGLRDPEDMGLGYAEDFIMGWPGDGEFEKARVLEFGGDNPAPDDDPFHGFAGSVAIVETKHDKDGRYCNVEDARKLLPEEFEEQTGMPQDGYFAAMDAQPFFPPSRRTGDLKAWLIEKDQEEDPQFGGAPGAGGGLA